MNKKIILGILAIQFIAFRLIAQTEQQAVTFNLDLPITWSVTYTAKQQVTLNPGFLADGASNNKTFTAQINTSLTGVPTDGGVGDLSVGLPAGYETTTPSTPAPGALPAMVDVSPSGAASCQLPFDFPEGFGALKPNLSLVYNSQSGNGLFGKSWDLSGLSMITRVPEDQYYMEDADCKSISLTSADRFVIDGMRLVKKTGDYGANGSTYLKESNDFSTITSFGSSTNGPDYFLVEAKDKSKIWYGKVGTATDANLLVPGTTKIISWYVKKMQDARGNYIRFNYSQTATGQMCISSIEYTLNDGGSIAAQYTINFTYSTYSPTENFYVAGYKFVQNQCITAVQCSNNVKYTFQYSTNKLTTVRKLKNDALVCTPTTINWDINSYSLQTVPELASFEGLTNFDYNQGYVATYNADFNGDGKNELLRINQYEGKWQIYTYESNVLVFKSEGNIASGNTYTVSVPITTTCYYFNEDGDRKTTNDCTIGSFQSNKRYLPYTAYDADNDGILELIYVVKSSTEGQFNYVTYKYNSSQNTFLSMGSDYSESNIGTIAVNDRFLVGDFNGDGINDPILINSGSDVDFNLPAAGINKVGFGFKQAFIGNFNNDRKNDLFVVNDNEVMIYEPRKGSGTSYSFFNIGHLYNVTTDKMQTGDFNGDNLTDLLIFNTSTGNWDIHYANGNNTFIKQADVINGGHRSPHTLDFLNWDDKVAYEASGANQYRPSTNVCIFQVADFNSDGKTDVFQIVRELGCSGDYHPNGTREDFVVNYYANLYYSTGAGLTFNGRIDGPYFRYDELGIPTPVNERPDNIFGDIHLVQHYIFMQPVSQITDINSDGFPEFLYSNQGSEMRLSTLNYPLNDHATAIQFHFDYNDNKVTSIQNGMEVKTELSYTLLSKFSRYTQGDRIVGTGVFSKEIPLNVVSKIAVNLALNNPGYISEKEISYNSALITHRRGFVGFKSIETNDLRTMEKMKTEYSLQMDKLVNRPFKTSTFKNNTLLGYEENGIVYDVIEGTSAYTLLPDYTRNTNSLTSTVVETDFNYLVDDGDLEWKKETFGNDGYFLQEYMNRNDMSQAGWVKSTRRQNNEDFITNEYYTYDSYGNALTYTNNDGIISTYIYDLNNHTNLMDVSDNGLGVHTVFTYTPNKRFIALKSSTYSNGVIRNISFLYDAEGRILRETDADGMVTSYQYDILGNLEVKLNPNGRRETYCYGWIASSDHNWYRKTTDDIGNISSVEYDKAGRTLKNSITPAGGIQINISKNYNSDGTLMSEVSSIDGTTSYTYWTNGRIKSVTSKGRVVNYEYSGRKTTTTINGIASSKTLNAFGQIVEAKDAGGTITYSYDATGQPDQIVTNGSTIENVYNAKGRQEYLKDPDQGNIHYEYDQLGRLWKQTDAKGNLTVLSYDELGRLSQKSITPSGGATRLIIYNFDPSHTERLTSVTDNESEINIVYTYDNLGRMVTKTETIEGQLYTFGYQYDTDGRLLKLTYPDGYYVIYEYQGLLIKSVKDGETGTTLFSNITYNARGQITSESLGNGNTLTNVYDSYGYIDNSTFGPSSNRINYDYNFDPATQLLNSRKRTYIASGTFINESFTYDAVERLTNWRVTQNGINTDYSINYSSNGNITQKSDMGFYSYDNTQPHAVDRVYELSGTSIDSRDCNITYNGVNKVKQMVLSNSGTTTHTYTITYGPDNERRISQLNTEKTIYTGLYEVRSNGNRLHYIKLNGKLAAVRVKNSNTMSNEMYYLYTDHLGSIVAVATQTGSITKEFSYDPWGRRRNASNWNDYNVVEETLFTLGFTGHESIAAFGLINMNGRMYDPRLGRFLSPDNVIQAPEFSQNFNRYSYVYNNPLKYTDPSGNYIPFFIYPYITWSKDGGFGVGITAGIGVPGILSAQISIGYNFSGGRSGFGEFNFTVGATAFYNTVYASYSPSSKWTLGYTFGISPGSLPVSTNFLSIGVSWNKNMGVTYSISAWNYNKNIGWSFNPSLSASGPNLLEKFNYNNFSRANNLSNSEMSTDGAEDPNDPYAKLRTDLAKYNEELVLVSDKYTYIKDTEVHSYLDSYKSNNWINGVLVGSAFVTKIPSWITIPLAAIGAYLFINDQTIDQIYQNYEQYGDVNGDQIRDGIYVRGPMSRNISPIYSGSVNTMTIYYEFYTVNYGFLGVLNR